MVSFIQECDVNQPAPLTRGNWPSENEKINKSSSFMRSHVRILGRSNIPNLGVPIQGFVRPLTL